jgi:hypothetical protein
MGSFKRGVEGNFRVICGRSEMDALMGLFRGEGGSPCMCAEAVEAAGSAREFRWCAEIQPPVLKSRAARLERTGGRNSVSVVGGSALAPRSRSSFAGGETVRCRGERSQSAALTLGTRRKRHAKPGKLSRPFGAGDLLHGRSQGCAPASLALGWLVSGPWPEPHWTHFASRPIPAGVTKSGAVQGLLVFEACGRGGG